MTCFWNGILSALKDDDYIFIQNKKKPMKAFIEFLKSKNCLTHNVSWNGQELHKQEKIQNFNAIKDFKIGLIRGGHLTSTCDYFLLLIAEIFCVNIDHYYLNKPMKYRNQKLARKTLIFRSNYGHFWHSSK